jgi:hypothetical protein
MKLPTVFGLKRSTAHGKIHELVLLVNEFFVIFESNLNCNWIKKQFYAGNG